MSKRGKGYTHVHIAIDAYSQLAYSELARGLTATAFRAFGEVWE